MRLCERPSRALKILGLIAFANAIIAMLYLFCQGRDFNQIVSREKINFLHKSLWTGCDWLKNWHNIMPWRSFNHSSYVASSGSSQKSAKVRNQGGGKTSYRGPYSVTFVRESTCESVLSANASASINLRQTLQQSSSSSTSAAVVFHDVANDHPEVTFGGNYKPPEFKGNDKLAIIIPYRGRWYHLRLLLHFLHTVLQRQGLAYSIYVIQQSGKALFNKASLMNVGFLEAMKRFNYNCVVFHDVDLVPENYKCLYKCSANLDQVRHISVAISKFLYRPGFGITIGGISAFTPSQMRRVNGWSNQFKGWGGEDDDMAIRLKTADMRIARPPRAVCRFTHLPHTRDEGNPLNPKRFPLLRSSASRMRLDGLSSVRHGPLSITEHATYTNITVRF